MEVVLELCCKMTEPSAHTLIMKEELALNFGQEIMAIMGIMWGVQFLEPETLTQDMLGKLRPQTSMFIKQLQNIKVMIVLQITTIAWGLLLQVRLIVMGVMPVIRL